MLYPKVLPTLYDSVHLESPTQCQDTLMMLRNTPEVARHVLELIVQPDRMSNTVAGYEESKEWCKTISNLVAECATHMDALRKFTWNAVAALPQERMWAELRSR